VLNTQLFSRRRASEAPRERRESQAEALVRRTMENQRRMPGVYVAGSEHFDAAAALTTLREAK
jgi:hypothetical protein